MSTSVVSTLRLKCEPVCTGVYLNLKTCYCSVPEVVKIIAMLKSKDDNRAFIFPVMQEIRDNYYIMVHVKCWLNDWTIERLIGDRIV